MTAAPSGPAPAPSVNGVASPRPAASAPFGAIDWQILGLQLAVALGVGVAALLILLVLGYDLRTSAVFGGLATIVGSIAARSFVRRKSLARESEADEAPQQSDGVREIVETVVFVVVLVLLLKSFAAEAFVIPTGSMAETLYGYQKVVTCPECGLTFPVNCSNEADPQDGVIRPVWGCVCPSCRKHLHFPRPALADRGDWDAWLSKFPDSAEVPNTGWSSGDRVLVAKFLYELLNKRPNRLDVVVFKYPGDASFPVSGPNRNYVPMNYIKRLVGLPGETIAIHRGKLYVLPADHPDAPKYHDYEEALKDPSAMATLWQERHFHKDEAVELFDRNLFKIIRKSPENMLAMRRLVFDNEHQARDTRGDLPPRWAGAGWKEDGAGFRSEGEGPSARWLRYGHYLRTNPRDSNNAPKRSLITDFTGYNTYEDRQRTSPPGENWVGDLMSECEVTVEKPEGELVLELSKTKDRFRLYWNLATGDLELYRLKDFVKADDEHDGKPGEKLAARKTAQPKKGGTYRLRLANIDDKLTVWLDNDLPFGEDGVTYPGYRDQGPTELNDLEPASIGLRSGAAVAVRKLKLFRDTYYTTGGSHGPSQADVTVTDFTDPDRWRELDKRMPTRTMYVQPNHFLCLGDNSPESSDGRTWGAVPERLLLGRAMLVYYPLGRAGRIH